jgi:hypothetical protein
MIKLFIANKKLHYILIIEIQQNLSDKQITPKKVKSTSLSLSTTPMIMPQLPPPQPSNETVTWT